MNVFTKIALLIIGLLLWAAFIGGALVLTSSFASVLSMAGAGVLAYLGSAIGSGLIVRSGSRLTAFSAAWFGLVLALLLFTLAIWAAVSTSYTLPVKVLDPWSVTEILSWLEALGRGLTTTMAKVVGGEIFLATVLLGLGTFKGSAAAAETPRA